MFPRARQRRHAMPLLPKTLRHRFRNYFSRALDNLSPLCPHFFSHALLPLRCSFRGGIHERLALFYGTTFFGFSHSLQYTVFVPLLATRPCRLVSLDRTDA